MHNHALTDGVLDGHGVPEDNDAGNNDGHTLHAVSNGVGDRAYALQDHVADLQNSQIRTRVYTNSLGT